MATCFKRGLTLAIALSVAALCLPIRALADPPADTLQNFGPNLRTQCPNPEGIAIDPTGNLYAAAVGNGHICVISPAGVVTSNFAIPPGSGGVTVLLGELFEPSQGLYVVDIADDIGDPSGNTRHGRLLKVDPATHAVIVLATGFAGPNAIAQDRHRNLFVSDSFLGTIFKVAPDGSSVIAWAHSSLLTTTGSPPFGANGLAFDRDEKFLYVANTGDNRVLRVPVERNGTAGAVEVFADGATINAEQNTTQALHGADGIMFDKRGNLYVCANQANEIQVLSPQASLIARYSASGANALDFPASLVFKGRQLFITNLSLSDGGVNSKLSVLSVPHPGLPLRP